MGNSAIKKDLKMELPKVGGADEKAVSLNIKPQLQGRLTCKICKKTYASADNIKFHILETHFEKLSCPICDYATGLKGAYIVHIKTQHSKADASVIQNLLSKAQNLKPNMDKFKYE